MIKILIVDDEETVKSIILLIWTGAAVWQTKST